jgi:hypothetical protein
MYGTKTMVNNSSICCNDSLHSLSASDTYSSSSTEDAVGEDGRESISSASEELSGRSMKLSLLLMDMAQSAEMVGQVIGIGYEGIVWEATVNASMLCIPMDVVVQ